MEKLTLVLLPGLDGTGLLFEPLMRVLPEWIEGRVVRYPCDRPMDYEQALEIVLKALPDEGPFAILGESFSGPLAVMVAAQSPPGLQVLILCASFVTKPLPWVPSWTRHMLFPWMFAIAPLLARAKTHLPERSAPGLRPLLLKANSMVTSGVWCARIRALMGVNVTEELRRCKVPILYLRAMRDWVVGGSNARRVMHVRPDVQVAMIDSGHLILQTHPVEAAGGIEDFLREVKAT